MGDLTLNLDIPSDYGRLRDLVAPPLARYEPRSARPEAESRDDIPRKLPSTSLPSRYGDPSTWMQAEQQCNEDMKKLLVGWTALSDTSAPA